jgi:hypothetical protein
MTDRQFRADRLVSRLASDLRTNSGRMSPGEGVEGNARLTAAAATLLLVLLAAEGATLPAIGTLVRPHVFIGFALIPPVALKVGSTAYRFARYYTGGRDYRRKGPPPTALRLLGPVVVLATVALLATGVLLVFVGDSWQGRLLTLHKASFVLWFAAMTIHVLAHVVDTARLAPRDWPLSTAPSVRGAAVRRWTLAVCVLAGALLGAWALGHLGVWALRAG